ncbi:hypothetical protein [Zavarzinella formosa]|uniref:hypothetical protein n=1 Tax=Zavarzinella formosa TaxID=360055 RepID=UPI0002DF0B7A|nr:hypothetical protein [Zavarzinella formosa]
MTLKERIFAASDIKLAPLVVPEWGNETVYLKTLTAGQSLRIEEGKSNTEQASLLVQYGCVDENGKPLFTADEVKRLLEEKSADGFVRVAKALREHNGVKTVEDEVKN